MLVAAVWSILSSIAKRNSSRHLGTAADAEEMTPWNIKRSPSDEVAIGGVEAADYCPDAGLLHGGFVGSHGATELPDSIAV